MMITKHALWSAAASQWSYPAPRCQSYHPTNKSYSSPPGRTAHPFITRPIKRQQQTSQDSSLDLTMGKRLKNKMLVWIEMISSASRSLIRKWPVEMPDCLMKLLINSREDKDSKWTTATVLMASRLRKNRTSINFQAQRKWCMSKLMRKRIKWRKVRRNLTRTTFSRVM